MKSMIKLIKVLMLLVLIIVFSCKKEDEQPYCWLCDKIETVTFGTKVTTKVITAKEMGWTVSCGVTESEMEYLTNKSKITLPMVIDSTYYNPNGTILKSIITKGTKVTIIKCTKQ